LFTQISTYPLDPIIANGSAAVPSAKVARIFVTAAFPTRIVNFASGAISAGTISAVKFVIRLPKLSKRRTMPLIVFPETFGLGIANRTKSVISSPKLAVCHDLESQAVTGAKISRPWNVLLTGCLNNVRT